MKKFSADKYAWQATIDYRQHPEAYKVGKGEQGVLLCEPYKSEILPYWQFKTPILAQKSATIIYRLFLTYLRKDDFIGADMARKFLQMGFTRARRYANYKGGRKYEAVTEKLLEKGTGDPQKALSAAIFYAKWQKAEAISKYQHLKADWKQRYG